jgi:hypothetical protein
MTVTVIEPEPSVGVRGGLHVVAVPPVRVSVDDSNAMYALGRLPVVSHCRM